MGSNWAVCERRLRNRLQLEVSSSGPMWNFSTLRSPGIEKLFNLLGSNTAAGAALMLSVYDCVFVLLVFCAFLRSHRDI